MERIDWHLMGIGGTRACHQSLRQLEAGVVTLERRVQALERMSGWWMSRYVELYGRLVDAGMAPDLEGAEVSEWLRRRSASGGMGASGNGCGTGDGMGCSEAEERCRIQLQGRET
jgi:hypothetical protein